MKSETATITEAQNASQPSLSYAWYVVLVLMLVNALSFIDRQILSLLVGPIKQDLHISDSKIGLLQGLAFAAFYTFLGLPMGRIADRSNRRSLIAVGVFFWSLMTAGCAFARSFSSLFLARVGVGVGEATLGPSAFSLISDYFPKERLGTALSIFSAGIFIGSGLALMVGGAVVSAVVGMPATTIPLLGTIASWRLTFLIVGLPGLLVGLLMYTVREPLRRNLMQAASGEVARPTLSEVAAEVKLRWRSVAGIALGQSAQAMCVFALTAWMPTFFIRTFGWTPQRTGLTLGLLILVMGCVGMYAGGTVCDYWQRQRMREAPLKVAFISALSAGLFCCLALLIQHPVLTVVLMIPAYFFLSTPVGSFYASLQLIFPNQLRGQVGALLVFSITVGGSVLGPWFVGLLNDFWGAQMVGYSLALTIGLASLTSASLVRMTYAPYRIHHKMMHDSE